MCKKLIILLITLSFIIQGTEISYALRPTASHLTSEKAHSAGTMQPVEPDDGQDDSRASQASGEMPIPPEHRFENMDPVRLAAEQERISGLVIAHRQGSEVAISQFQAFVHSMRDRINAALEQNNLEEAENLTDRLRERFDRLISELLSRRRETLLLLADSEAISLVAAEIETEKQAAKNAMWLPARMISGIFIAALDRAFPRRHDKERALIARCTSLVEGNRNNAAELSASIQAAIRDFGTLFDNFLRFYPDAVRRVRDSAQAMVTPEQISALNRDYIERIVKPAIERTVAEQSQFSGREISEAQVAALLTHLGRTFDAVLNNFSYSAPAEIRQRAEGLRAERERLPYSLSHLAERFAPCNGVTPNDVYRVIIASLRSSGSNDRISQFSRRILALTQRTTIAAEELGMRNFGFGNEDYFRNAFASMAEGGGLRAVVRRIRETGDIMRWIIIRENEDVRTEFGEALLADVNDELQQMLVRIMFAESGHDSWEKSACVWQMGSLRHPGCFAPLYLVGLQGGHTANAAMTEISGLLTDVEFVASLEPAMRNNAVEMLAFLTGRIGGIPHNIGVLALSDMLASDDFAGSLEPCIRDRAAEAIARPAPSRRGSREASRRAAFTTGRGREAPDEGEPEPVDEVVISNYHVGWRFFDLAQRAIVAGLRSNEEDYRRQAIASVESSPPDQELPEAMQAMSILLNTGPAASLGRAFTHRISNHDQQAIRVVYDYLQSQPGFNRNVAAVITFLAEAFTDIQRMRAEFPDQHAERMRDSAEYRQTVEAETRLWQATRRFIPELVALTPERITEERLNIHFGEVVESLGGILAMTHDSQCREFILTSLNSADLSARELTAQVVCAHPQAVGPQAVVPMLDIGYQAQNNQLSQAIDNYIYDVLEEREYVDVFRRHLNEAYFAPYGIDISSLEFDNKYALVRFGNALAHIGSENFIRIGFDPERLQRHGWLTREHVGHFIALLYLYRSLAEIFGQGEALAMVAGIINEGRTFAVTQLQQVPFNLFNAQGESGNIFGPIISFMQNRLSIEHRIHMLTILGRAAGIVCTIDQNSNQQLTVQCFRPAIELSGMSALMFASHFAVNSVKAAAEPLERLFGISESRSLAGLLSSIRDILAALDSGTYAQPEDFVADVERLLTRRDGLVRAIRELPQVQQADQQRKAIGKQIGQLKRGLQQGDEAGQSQLQALIDQQRSFQATTNQSRAANSALDLNYLATLTRELAVADSPLSQAVSERGIAAIRERLEQEFVIRQAQVIQREIEEAGRRVIGSFLSDNGERVTLPGDFIITDELSNLIHACYTANYGEILRPIVRPIMRIYIFEGPRAALEHIYSSEVLTRLEAAGYGRVREVLFQGLSVPVQVRPPADLVKAREERLATERDEVRTLIEQVLQRHGHALELDSYSLAERAGLDFSSPLDNRGLRALYDILNTALAERELLEQEQNVLEDISNHIEHMRSIEGEQSVAMDRPAEIEFTVCTDLVVKSNMGVGFPSCLNLLAGSNRHAAIVNAFEPRPIVLYARTERGNREGRLLGLLTDRGIIIHREYKSTSFNLSPGWFRLLSALAERLDMPIIIPHNSAAGISGFTDTLHSEGIGPVSLPQGQDVFKVEMSRFPTSTWYNDLGASQMATEGGFQLQLQGPVYIIGPASKIIQGAAVPVEIDDNPQKSSSAGEIITVPEEIAAPAAIPPLALPQIAKPYSRAEAVLPDAAGLIGATGSVPAEIARALAVKPLSEVSLPHVPAPAATVLPERSFGNFPVPASTPAIKDNSRLKRGIDTSA